MLTPTVYRDTPLQDNLTKSLLVSITVVKQCSGVAEWMKGCVHQQPCSQDGTWGYFRDTLAGLVQHHPTPDGKGVWSAGV